jgi:hypothetical protein
LTHRWSFCRRIAEAVPALALVLHACRRRTLRKRVAGSGVSDKSRPDASSALDAVLALRSL